MNDSFSAMNYERNLPEKLKWSSGRKRILLVIVAAICFGMTVGLVVVIATLAIPRHCERNNVCFTQDCIMAASRLLSSMNLSVDPCVDFYSFTCGNWIENHKFLEPTGSKNILQEIQNAVDAELKDRLDQRDQSQYIPRAAEQVLKAYKTCLNESRYVDLTMMKELLDSIGGWPIVQGESWKDTDYDWVESVAQALGTLGVESIFSCSVDTDFKNPKRYILTVDQPEELEEEKFNKPLIQNKLLYIIKQMKEFKSTDHLKDDLAKIEQIDILVRKFSRPKEQRKDPSTLYHKMTVKELQTLAPQVAWLRFLQTSINTGRGDTNFKVNLSEEILVIEPNYISKMSEALDSGNFSSRDIANYIGWSVAANYMFAIPEYAAICHPEVENLKLLESNERDIKKEEVTVCISKVTEFLNFASDYILFRGKQQEINVAEDLILYIRNAFMERLKNSFWIDEKTKNFLHAKVMHMVSRSGFPQWILNTTRLDEYYEMLPELDSDNLNNFIHIAQFSVNKVFSQLGKTPPLHEWLPGDSMKQVNAYYMVHNNMIAIPMAVLQPPLFNRKWPWYMNFGAMGFIIGHEITHGFDDEGMKWDVKGILEPDWLDDDFREQFETRSQCFVEQFEDFSPLGFEKDEAEEMARKLSTEKERITFLINGSTTLGENIADSGGLIQAFVAYKNWELKNGKEPTLPGLENFTPEQMFFISFGATWCTRDTLDITLSQLLTDEHSPEKFRVVGSVSNSKHFAEVFNCPVGSPMNPHEKCILW